MKEEEEAAAGIVLSGVGDKAPAQRGGGGNLKETWGFTPGLYSLQRTAVQVSVPRSLAVHSCLRAPSYHAKTAPSRVL